MDLFIVENSVAIPSTHALLIEPFKSIWDRDKTPHRSQAIREFTFIELVCSMKASNIYSGYPEELRRLKVSQNVFPEFTEWYPDQLVEDAIVFYITIQEEASPSLRIIASAKRALAKVEEFLDAVDFTERTRTNGAVYKPQDVAATVKMLPETYASLDKMKQKAQQELKDNSKMRGEREVNYFEE